MIPNFWEQEIDAVKSEETQTKIQEHVEIIADLMTKENNDMVISTSLSCINSNIIGVNISIRF